MSTFVEERVVEMQFDNQKFEQNAQRTLSTLDKLKQSLNLSGASKGLEDVGNAARGINLSGLSSAAETVQAKFSALGVMGVTALANITNSAVNAGKRIVSALTIDPIKTGFAEYETQINAVQTILANTESKGTTLNDVNKALDILNTYADKTIYNFTEMTRNIGKFTAAGVDLDTSVSAIQGIANLAAVSGSSSQQASTAMYQLSQALASGTVKLQDWNSVVNAGMGGQVFQDALKRTATTMGTNVDALIKKYGSFRESLRSGWITTEVLTETLNQFTMAAEEGSKEWNEYKKSLMDKGYTEKQAEEILKMANTATDAATKVKTFTQLWDTLKEAAQSGWSQSWEIIVGDFEEAKALLTEISDTIGAMLGKSASSRNEMLQGWKDLGGRTALIDSVRNAFEGVMGVITPIKEALHDIFPPITSQQLFNLTEGLKNFTEKLKIGETTANNIKRTFKGVFALLNVGVTVVKAVAKGFMDLFGFVAPAGNGILAFTANLGDALVKFNEFITSSDVFNKTIQFIVTSVTTVTSKLLAFISAIKERLNLPGMEEFKAVLDRIGERINHITSTVTSMKDGVVGAAKAIGSAFEGSKIVQLLTTIWDVLKVIGGGLIDALGEAFGGLAEKIGNADFSSFFDLISTLSIGGIGAGIMHFLNTLSQTVANVGGLRSILDGVRGTMAAYQTELKSNTLLKIAGAIGILAAAIMVLSLVDSDKLVVTLAAITGLFADLMGAMTIFDKLGGAYKNSTKAVTLMIGMSVGISILAGAMKDLAGLDWNGVAKGLTSVSGLSAALVVSANALSKNNKRLVKGATSLVIFSAAIKVLASVCKDLSALSWEELGKGLTGVGVLLAELSIFLNTAKFGGSSISAAAGILILSGAMKILASACKDFGNMSWEEIGKGLLGVAGSLAAVTVAMNFMPPTALLSAASIAIVSVALIAMAKALQMMGSMSGGEIAKSLTALAGALTIFAVGLTLMIASLPGAFALMKVAQALLIFAPALKLIGMIPGGEIAKGLLTIAAALTIFAVGLTFMIAALPGAAALIVAAGALAVLAPVLAALGSMPFGNICKSLIAMAGSIAIMGVAAKLLTPMIPALLGLSGAIFTFGLACTAVGVGILAFATALSMLAVSGATGASALAASITVIINSVLNLLPTIVTKLGECLVSICEAITASAPAIGAAIKAVLISIIDIISQITPKIVNAGLELILALLEGISKNIGKITETAIDIVVKFIDGVASKISDIIESGINLMINFINGMADGIINNADATFDAIDNLMDSIIYAIQAWFKRSRENGKELVLNIIDGIKEKFESFKQAGKDMIEGFIQGVKDKASSVVEAAKGVVSDALEGAKNLLGIHSPSREFAKVGEQSDMGIIVGLNRFASKVANTAKDVGSGALDAMKDAIAGAADVFGSDLDTTPTIRPVLDLSDVKSGAKTIGNMISARRTLSINTSAAGSVAASMDRLQSMRETNEFVSAINGLRKDLSDMPRNTYIIDGITYDDGSNITDAVQTLVRHTIVGRRA